MKCMTIGEWKILFWLKGYITFSEKIAIKEVEIVKLGDNVVATMKIQATNIEEAQNIAAEKMENILAAISSVLKSKITAEIKEIKVVLQDGITTQTTSIMNARAKVLRKFPIDRINEIETIYTLSLQDDNVKKVISLLSKPYPETWENFYKIYEVINKDASIKGNKWATEKELDYFKRTANNPDVIGINDARHGHTTDKSFKNPISIEEATKLIDGILNKWIEYKKEKLL